MGGGGGGYISSNCVDSHDNGFDAYIIFYYSILVVCLHLINNEHSRTIRAVVHTKWKIHHNLLVFMSFQTWMTFSFLWTIKENILKNIFNQCLSIQWMSVGVQCCFGPRWSLIVWTNADHIYSSKYLLLCSTECFLEQHKSEEMMSEFSFYRWEITYSLS